MSAPLTAGISIREFARREGCDDKLVRRKIKSCHLKALPDGTLDPELVGSGWNKTNRRTADTADISVSVRTQVSAVSAPSLSDEWAAAAHKRTASTQTIFLGETPAETAERIISAIGPTMDQVEAERVKENYLALLRQLEYDTKSGAVVLVEDVTKAVAAEYAKVRTRLLAIPAAASLQDGRRGA